MQRRSSHQPLLQHGRTPRVWIQCDQHDQQQSFGIFYLVRVYKDKQKDDSVARFTKQHVKVHHFYGYLTFKWSHILPGVCSGIIALHAVQLGAVVTTSNGIDVVIHDTHTVVSMLLLKRCNVTPGVVSRIVSGEVSHTPDVLNTHTEEDNLATMCHVSQLNPHRAFLLLTC